ASQQEQQHHNNEQKERSTCSRDSVVLNYGRHCCCSMARSNSGRMVGITGLQGNIRLKLDQWSCTDSRPFTNRNVFRCKDIESSWGGYGGGNRRSDWRASYICLRIFLSRGPDCRIGE